MEPKDIIMEQLNVEGKGCIYFGITAIVLFILGLLALMFFLGCSNIQTTKEKEYRVIIKQQILTPADYALYTADKRFYTKVIDTLYFGNENVKHYRFEYSTIDVYEITTESYNGNVITTKESFLDRLPLIKFVDKRKDIRVYGVK